MRYRNYLFGIFAITLTSQTYAHSLVREEKTGGMSGGGGGALLLDRNNPWFLDNVQTVDYCISTDPNSFHVDTTVISDTVKKAIQYWKDEFSVATPVTIEPSIRAVRTGTQWFQEVSCDKPHDLTFQMGHLTIEQQKDLGDATSYGGVAVRTAYDKATLHGKGYIYVGADSGPLKFKGLPEHHPNLWARGKGGILFQVIVHELGHVFGISHQGARYELMGEGFVESLMSYSDRVLDHYADFLDAPSFFTPTGKSVSWSSGMSGADRLPQKTIRFFGFPADANLVWLQIKGPNLISVETRVGNESSRQFGTITLKKPEGYLTDDCSTLYLPEGQTVYPSMLDGARVSYLPVTLKVTYVQKGTYRSHDGNVVREVVAHIKPQGPEWFLGGMIDGVFDINVMGFLSKENFHRQGM